MSTRDVISLVVRVDDDALEVDVTKDVLQCQASGEIGSKPLLSLLGSSMVKED